MKKVIAKRVYFWPRSTMTRTPRTRRKLPYHYIQFNAINYFDAMKYIHENKIQLHYFLRYKENLLKLQKLVLVKFNEDSVVDPRGTEWFNYYEPGQGQRMLPYNETDLYKEDWIGLKTLNEDGRVDFLSVEGDHLRFDDKFFIDVIIGKYLKDSN